VRSWLELGGMSAREGGCGSLVVFTNCATRARLSAPLGRRCVLSLAVAHEPPTIGLARRRAFGVA
jgi:hypothetical protein